MMSRLDELPPDQRAALSLLLRQRKSYAEVAVLLGIAEQAVHDRAHAALAVLAPRQARGLDAQRREEIGDYLLGQQTGVAERLRTRTRLASEEPERAWALAIAEQLGALGAPERAEIPPPLDPPAPSASAALRPPAPARAAVGAAGRAAGSTGPPELASTLAARAQAASAGTGDDPPGSSPGAPSSRLGGALLLGALIVAIAVAVILIATSNGGSGSGKAATKSSTTSTASAKSGPKQGPRLALHSPNASSRSVGVVEILSEGTKRAFYIDAEHLPETRNFFYAIWLYNSHTSAEALSKSPAVGTNHKLAGGALLPANAGQFHEILLTRETSTHPSKPGKVVLRGVFSLG